MNHLTHLHKQVRTAILAETKMEADERALHQWQFLTNVGGKTYLVGKGGANTMFYKIGNAEIKYAYPEQMLDILKEWANEKYAVYSIVSPKDKSIKRQSTDINDLLAKIPKKYKKYRIFGTANTGSNTPLYELRKSIVGSTWVKL